jgi:hypothetical protein
MRIALLLGLLAAARPAHARAVELAIDDVLGEHVHIGGDGVSIVYLMSRAARDEAKALVRAVDERLAGRKVDAIGIVDLHRFGGMFKRMALSAMQRSQREAHTRRWHLCGDFDGALFARFAVERDPAHPLAFVVDKHGEVRGPFASAEAVLGAVLPLVE